MSTPAAWRQPDFWLFDLDNTLYPASCRLFDQIDRRMTRFIADYLGVADEEANRLRRDLWAEHGTTLNGLMLRYRMSPAAFLDYVHDVDLALMDPAPALGQALARLPGRKLVFTNGTRPHAERILDRLGIAGHFDAIHDIVAADYVPKPQDATYAEVVARYGLDPRRTAMVEDSAHNLPPAARLGMTTVWIRHGESHHPGEAADHIHHTTEDLAVWLDSLPHGDAASHL
jgi:putative hydrolase of the HAD superfamily